MILTQELLDRFNPCADGMIIANELGCIDIDGKEAIKILRENNHTDYALWVRSLYQNSEAIKFAKFDKKIKYLVYDPVQHIYRTSSELSLAYEIIEKIKTENPDCDFDLITLQEEIVTLDDQVHRFLIK